MDFLSFFRRSAVGAAMLAVSLGATAASFLDPQFGTNGDGRAFVAGGDTGGAAGPQSILVNPVSGRILYAARRPALGDMVVGALTRDGFIDLGFNDGDPLVIPVPGTGVMYSPHLAAQTVDSLALLVATDFSGGVYRPVVCQIRDDGSLDPNFTSGQYPGQTGCIRLDVPGSVAPNGVVLAGIAPGEAAGILRFGGTGYDFGSPTNTTFPVTGLLLVGTDENPSSAFVRESTSSFNVVVNGYALHRLDNGVLNAYLAGSQTQNGDVNLYVGRRFYAQTSDYQDTWFAVNLVGNGVDVAQAVSVDYLGRPLIAATVDSTGGITTCMVQRLTETLAPDVSFGPSGTSGRKFVHFDAAPNDSARCDAVAAYGTGNDYRVLVGGSAMANGNREMATARLYQDGSPDADFGSAGGAIRVSNAPEGAPPWNDQVLALALQGDNPILAGPSAAIGATPETSDMCFVRLAEDAIFADGFD